MGPWRSPVPLAAGRGRRGRLGHGPFRTTKLAERSHRGRRGNWRAGRLSHPVGFHGFDLCAIFKLSRRAIGGRRRFDWPLGRSPLPLPRTQPARQPDGAGPADDLDAHRHDRRRHARRRRQARPNGVRDVLRGGQSDAKRPSGPRLRSPRDDLRPSPGRRLRVVYVASHESRPRHDDWRKDRFGRQQCGQAREGKTDPGCGSLLCFCWQAPLIRSSPFRGGRRSACRQVRSNRLT